MKILTATKQTQGQRKNDFSWTTEGEPVKFGSECDGEHVDGSCGCKRALCGMTTSKATTTMKVIDDPDITAEAFHAAWLAAMSREGWLRGCTTTEIERWQKQDCADLLRIAAAFPAGSVIEKRGNKFNARILGAD